MPLPTRQALHSPRFSSPLCALCLAVLLAVTAAQLAGARPPKTAKPPARHGRDTQSLGVAWTFHADPGGLGEKQGWPGRIPDGAVDARVPGIWPMATTGWRQQHGSTGYTSMPAYNGAAWYWRRFRTPATWKGQTVRLLFSAISGSATVWINGAMLGAHSDPAVPFGFNITRHLKPADDNLIAVRVIGEAASFPGIWQLPLLVAHDEAYIDDAAVRANALGAMSIGVTIVNTSANSGGSQFDARLMVRNQKLKVLASTEQNLLIAPGLNVTTIQMSVKGRDLHRWSPTTPSLYTLQLSFRQDADILDNIDKTIGFRQFGMKGGVITLNGEPLAIKSSRFYGTARSVIQNQGDLDDARQEDIAGKAVQRLKGLGTNVLFLNAPAPEWLLLADELGMLVVEGAETGLPADRAASELRELVVRDRSHPCILAWNTGSGLGDALAALRTLDDTRFTIMSGPDGARLRAPGAAGEEITLPAELNPQ